MSKVYYVYILTNIKNNVLYTGVTNNLVRRIYEHKNKLIKGFFSKYNLVKLVYYEEYLESYQAILREKQIKAGSRQKKINLINKFNKNWFDLFLQL
ncbi:MAG: GIY-YIG nuclease family protein [Patescibacteria group bacterium]